jgi:DNA-directed RNA polymerase specialized sigma24 family protein
MTARQAPGVDDLRPAPAEPCPCGHGDVAAVTDRQRPLVMRAIQGDPEAFASLYDDHVDDVYRYLLAWTWDQEAARDLTEQVFRGAVTWLPAIAEGEGDLGSWLIALARDAVGQHLGAGWMGQVQEDGPPQDPFDAVEQLDAAQREVVVLRLLLGHSVGHTAHLAGYDARVVQDLQFAGCATVWQLLSGTPLDPPPHGHQELRPRWFEYCLAGATMDLDADPGLADVLAVADALRQGAGEQVPLPEDVFVAWLRNQLLQPVEGDPVEAPPLAMSRLGRAFALVRYHLAHHPWAATIVAAVAIGLVIGLQLAGGSTPPPTTCADETCTGTTVAAAQDETTPPSLPLVGGPGEETTSSTLAVLGLTSTSTTSRPSSTTRRASSTSTTVPPTTVPRTTTTRLPTTTTRQPTTTTKPTTTKPKPQVTTTTTTTTTPQRL